jgi:hypothetical protein
MSKTPIQQAISRLDRIISNLSIIDAGAKDTETIIYLKQERLFLETLLPTEQEVIETAYEQGYLDSTAREAGNGYAGQDDYFTTKFNNK